MLPRYDINKIKFATDPQTFERAVALYEAGKVTKFREDAYGCSAVVLGTQPYRVSVDARHYDRGNCDCYLGQKDVLCKHMVAVAIRAVTLGEPLLEEEKQRVCDAVCSGQVGELTKEQLTDVKKKITSALRYIKGYTGPSRIWFAYQSSLCEGCAHLSAIVSELPVSKQISDLLVELLLRLDKKLCTGGVDDSDGTVGGFMRKMVEVLEEYARLDAHCIQSFEKLCGRETCFEWEESLVRIVDEGAPR
ncbi:MAG: hypothetical protein Q8P56_02780 [Candidatus Uhrbacteria bacterium]|nr:hypothetical protein [Candidatus Uhrbacteria bacterium]